MSAETRPCIEYAGKRRGRINRKTGELEHIHQRELARPYLSFEWTQSDQAEAIKRDFFLQRHAPRNHVWVRSVSGRDTDSAVCNELERYAFLGDPHALKALLFIEQQDRYGWSGAWDRPAIETMGQLRWFKDICAANRKDAQAARPHFKALAEKRWAKGKHT